MKNEKGMTLVEVLATLVIASLFMGIIYTVVMMSMEYSSVETTKTRLQQEANYIITEIQRIHRKGDCYVLSITENEVAIAETEMESCPETDSKMRVLSSEYKYDYDIELDEDGEKIVFDKKEIHPNINNVKLTNLSIKDAENADIHVEISTIISRYKNTE
ncbi:hypothetical protein CWR48_16970 [Oceanobacillus arenosus]|uniref:Prepilin-type cleavage/methylation domain-containing protein n=1 Tax=Oceanobacillus arenosus TaxID=1229153 RepID=A0A3D8PJS9_9BACI|nr:type II secretion system protein [Oceanobacillus arenosus]RDW16336.1 hypothetical protein CWR48_16970 [Oceanobacillus arenosus]